jgi:hypothetical protein
MRYSHPIEKIVERYVERTQGGRTDASTGILGELGRLQSAVRALESIAINRNPAHTDAAHFKAVHDAGGRLQKAATATRQRAAEILNSQSEKLRQELAARTGLRPAADLLEATTQAEIRAAVRSMGSQKRGELLQRAVEAKDVTTLNALLHGPAFLTGLDDKLLAVQRERYERTVAPEVLEKFDAVIEADETLSTITKLAERAASEAQDARAAASFIAAETAAREASATFDAALQ